MLCQRCNNKEATVHLTKIVNGEKNEVFLCEECARETGQLPFAGNDPFSFQNLLSGILNPEINSYNTGIKQGDKCGTCGLSYYDFTQNGLFGCADCYETFNDRLNPLLKRIHGETVHNGKVPQRKGGHLRKKRQIKELRDEMQDAVKNENFEKAAEIRDKIKELEDNDGGE
ncbi:UvrB/UvrC motif-containing protein [Halocella sp. SP3-1]|uniref:UvrB/UvrC motif-containing protein n=1 Tax=Halocella sp. SP3-1 TaxID=2382161 RepID=UPI000F75313F|nr:UvrB/UvrC motif-containing protein [Halocella sp. SP3-1]AZO96578.1 hypothetical protein D7D81_19340 [Halocella sp. SP3-1]